MRPSFFTSLFRSPLSIPHHCFPLSHFYGLHEPGNTSSFLPSLSGAYNARDTVFVWTPLFLSHSTATFLHSRGIKGPKVCFLSLSIIFLHCMRAPRLFLCLKRVCYAPFFAECRGFRTQLLFIFLSTPYALRQLTDPRFSFFFLRFLHQARVLRRQQALSGITAITAVLSSHHFKATVSRQARALRLEQSSS